MTPEVSQASIECLTNGAHALVTMYTDTALTLNACDVAAKSYAARTDEFRLSTTQNIPPDFRLPVELDMAFLRHELPAKYQGSVIQRICEDFAIRLISVLDGIFEDILEVVTPLVEPGVDELEVSKRVRTAWQQEQNGHVKLVNYLVAEAGLKSPPGKKSTVEMVFDRYYEMREIRHALVHTGGTLSRKHLQRLSALSERLPPEFQNGSLAGAQFLKSGRVVADVQVILGLRHWAYTTILGYLRGAFEQSVTT
jgi:hypothetical protein